MQNDPAGGGVFLSNDGGNTFKRTDVFPCTEIIADHTNGKIMYRVSLQEGIFESKDAGNTWKRISEASLYTWFNGAYNRSPVRNVRMTLHVNATTGTRALYAGIMNRQPIAIIRGEYDATTDLWSWKQLDTPYTVEGDDQVGISPDEDDDDEEGDEEAGSQGTLHLSIAAEPTNPFIVYIAGDRQPIGANSSFPNSIGANDFSGRIFKIDASKPNGTQFLPLTHRYAAQNSAPHADSRCLAIDAVGNLLESDDGGVFKVRNHIRTCRNREIFSIFGAF